MVDKTVKELADISKKDPQELLKQLTDAGLPARGETDVVSEKEQEHLVEFLQKSHGQTAKKRISIKAKTTTTAKITDTSGKAKTSTW